MQTKSENPTFKSSNAYRIRPVTVDAKRVIYFIVFCWHFKLFKCFKIVHINLSIFNETQIFLILSTNKDLLLPDQFHVKMNPFYWMKHLILVYATITVMKRKIQNINRRS
jgi:hypothetical protein